MGDQKAYKLRAIGPATKLSAVDPESVRIMSSEEGAKPVDSGLLTPSEFIQFAALNNVEWSLKTVGSEVGVGETAAFTFHWAPYDDTTGLLSATGLSWAGTLAVIPIDVSAKISEGKTFEEAVTTYKGVFMDSNPTWGTTAGAPPAETVRYGIGPSTMDGTAIDRLISQKLEFGIEAVFDIAESGALKPTTWFVKTFKPIVTYETRDLSLVSDYVNAGATITSDTVLKFQNAAGTGGKTFTLSKGKVFGSIKGDIGEIKVMGLNATTVLAAGSY